MNKIAEQDHRLFEKINAYEDMVSQTISKEREQQRNLLLLNNDLEHYREELHEKEGEIEKLIEKLEGYKKVGNFSGNFDLMIF